MQTEKVCYITGSTEGLHFHHVYRGRNRGISDRKGFTVWLRADWHVCSPYSVHEDHRLMLRLQRECQREYEKTHSRAEFIRLIGRSYL